MRTETEIRQMLVILEAFNSKGKHEDEMTALKWVLSEYPPAPAPSESERKS